jgi:hypothetical protein
MKVMVQGRKAHIAQYQQQKLMGNSATHRYHSKREACRRNQSFAFSQAGAMFQNWSE